MQNVDNENDYDRLDTAAATGACHPGGRAVGIKVNDVVCCLKLLRRVNVANVTGEGMGGWWGYRGDCHHDANNVCGQTGQVFVVAVALAKANARGALAAHYGTHRWP